MKIYQQQHPVLQGTLFKHTHFSIPIFLVIILWNIHIFSIDKTPGYDLHPSFKRIDRINWKKNTKNDSRYGCHFDRFFCYRRHVWQTPLLRTTYLTDTSVMVHHTVDSCLYFIQDYLLIIIEILKQASKTITQHIWMFLFNHRWSVNHTNVMYVI